MSKDGIVKLSKGRVYFTKVIRSDKHTVRLMLKSGWVVQLPRKNIIRLPEGTVI